MSGLLMAAVFGGIHCMAWFFAFPTNQDQVLWRMSAVLTTCIPWLALFVGIIAGISDNAIISGFAGLIWILCPIVYIPARVILLVLMAITLRNLPPDAYTAVSWISLVPHL
ncbi:hypothetical protein EDB19DRAFT_1860550 [Suillus lakei]|nr:hypothetical protein EDB19DRAFT_1860550 [Suillus lakei]